MLEILGAVVMFALGAGCGMFYQKERAAGRTPEQIILDAQVLAAKVASKVK